MARFDVDQLRLDIEALIRDYPEIAEDETLRADMLDAETGIHEALTLLVNDIDSSKMMIVGITARRKELEERCDRLVHRVEGLRALVLKVLQSAELKTVSLPGVTLSQQRSQPQIVGEPNPDALPDDLVRIKREANRTAIREALLNGRAIPGLTLSNAAPHLIIRVR
jgi:hypothetical protein